MIRSRGAASDAGVSAVQTMVVLVIVAALIYAALPVWARLVERARAASCQQNQRNIAEAVAVARADGNVGAFVGYFDSPLDSSSPWGRTLIPVYIDKAPSCPVSGQEYNMSPFGRIWSDRGAGQYTWVNQSAENDHQLKSQ